jgi:hypothetical protein
MEINWYFPDGEQGKIIKEKSKASTYNSCHYNVESQWKSTTISSGVKNEKSNTFTYNSIMVDLQNVNIVCAFDCWLGKKCTGRKK